MIRREGMGVGIRLVSKHGFSSKETRARISGFELVVIYIQENLHRVV